LGTGDLLATNDIVANKCPPEQHHHQRLSLAIAALHAFSPTQLATHTKPMTEMSE
jgi:hypothetical protein